MTLVVLISVITVVSQVFAASDVGAPKIKNTVGVAGCPTGPCTSETCATTKCEGTASSDCQEGTVCSPPTSGTCKQEYRCTVNQGAVICAWVHICV
jgi:hypothetical protein